MDGVRRPVSDVGCPMSDVGGDEQGHSLAFAGEVRTRPEILACSSRDVSVEEVVLCLFLWLVV